MAKERTSTCSHSHLALHKNHLKSNVSMHVLIYKHIYNNITITRFLFDRNSFISAELPDSTQDLILHNMILKQMVHGPCGDLNRNSPCMQYGWPLYKILSTMLLKETQTSQDGYPLYRRRKPEEGRWVCCNGHNEKWARSGGG